MPEYQFTLEEIEAAFTEWAEASGVSKENIASAWHDFAMPMINKKFMQEMGA